MQSSYLIQRLKRPYPQRDDGVPSPDEVFAFGGGHLRGGLSKEAFDILARLWSWDYMGAVEFEFGAVPKALDYLRNRQDDLVAFSLPVKYEHEDYRNRKTLSGESTVYVICPGDFRSEVEDRIRYHAAHDFARDPGYRVKEHVGLSDALAGEERAPIGWLELDNGYLFFADRETWEGTCELFEVEPEESDRG